MIYARQFEQNTIDREQDAYDMIVAWLSNQPPEVWLWFARRGNWDTCIPVFTWMVEQPVCDAAVVASLFWEAGPAFFAQEIAASAKGFDDGEYSQLIRTILLVWHSRPSCDVRCKLPNVNDALTYQAMIANEWGGVDPLRVPEWLFGPFGDRDEENPAHYIVGDDELRDAFLALGMWHGDTPPDALTGVTIDGPAIVSPAERRLQIAIGLALMTPMILLLCWYLYR